MKVLMTPHLDDFKSHESGKKAEGVVQCFAMPKKRFVCQRCEKEFFSYGKLVRKFCSRECYELNKRILSENECREVIALYQKGKSARYISGLYGVAHTTIASALRRNQIVSRGITYHRKFMLDETAFDTIDTEEKAYWLGFIYADGYVRGDGLAINLKISDEGHLEKAKIFFRSTASLRYQYSERGDTVRVAFHSSEMAKKLVNLGIVPHRSKHFDVTLKSVPRYLIKHFVRGLIDGDGYISKMGASTPNIGFVGRKSATEWMKSFLQTLVSGNPTIRSKGEVYEITFGGIFQVKAIASFLYKDATIFLDRKKKLANYWIDK